MTDGAERNLILLLKALEPYSGEYVLIGGWVPWLFRKYGGLEWNGPLSGTTEADVLLQPAIHAGKRPHLREILERNGLEPRHGATHSAVWVRAANQTDALELFTPWMGPAKGRQTVGVEGQPGIDAITLQRLDLVGEFVTELKIPTASGTVLVRVPSLGAYIATKALTFTARPEGGSLSAATPKRGKDLLYIFDVMSAGPRVHRQIAIDLSDIFARDVSFSGTLRNAANNLTLITGKRPHPALAEAASALSVRDARSLAVAEASIKGAAQDLFELLDEGMERA